MRLAEAAHRSLAGERHREMGRHIGPVEAAAAGNGIGGLLEVVRRNPMAEVVRRSLVKEAVGRRARAPADMGFAQEERRTGLGAGRTAGAGVGRTAREVGRTVEAAVDHTAEVAADNRRTGLEEAVAAAAVVEIGRSTRPGEEVGL